MKTTNRILAVALALALGLALFAPIASANDPNAPIITRQPSGPVYILTGRTMTLEVQAQAPAGGTLSVAWFVKGQAEPIATGAKAELPSSNFGGYLYDEDRPDNIFIPGGYFEFYAVITNTYLDGEGEQQTSSITSDTIGIDIVTRPSFVLSMYWDITWRKGFLTGLLMLPLNMMLATRIMTGLTIEYLFLSF